MFEIVTSTVFKRFETAEKKIKTPFCRITRSVTILSQKGHNGLDKKHKAHKLTGIYKDYWECHVKPDLLLIWHENEQINLLQLVRTGTHYDLF